MRQNRRSRLYVDLNSLLYGKQMTSARVTPPFNVTPSPKSACLQRDFRQTWSLRETSSLSYHRNHRVAERVRAEAAATHDPYFPRVAVLPINVAPLWWVPTGFSSVRTFLFEVFLIHIYTSNASLLNGFNSSISTNQQIKFCNMSDNVITLQSWNRPVLTAIYQCRAVDMAGKGRNRQSTNKRSSRNEGTSAAGEPAGAVR